MEVLRSADVPIHRRGHEFRYSRVRAGAGATILAAVAVALIGFGRIQNSWIAYYIAGLILVALLMFHNLVTARFRPTNWLVRMTDDGLFIKFRSYLNHRFSDQDPPSFSFRTRDRLGKVGKRTSSNTGPRRSNPRATTIRTRRFIELQLRRQLEPLADALAGESKRVFAKPADGGANVSTRYQHLPVRLATPNLLRIEWASSRMRKPSSVRLRATRWLITPPQFRKISSTSTGSAAKSKNRPCWNWRNPAT